METGRTRNLRHQPAAGTRSRPCSSTRWSGSAGAERRRQWRGGGSKVETETDNKVLVAGEIDDAGNLDYAFFIGPFEDDSNAARVDSQLQQSPDTARRQE